MLRRSAALALPGALGLALLAGCGGTDDRGFGQAPPGLPADVGFNQAIYDHAKKVAALPPDVDRRGSVRGHGVLYAPHAGTAHPKAVWVTKNGSVWKYRYRSTMQFE